MTLADVLRVYKKDYEELKIVLSDDTFIRLTPLIALKYLSTDVLSYKVKEIEGNSYQTIDIVLVDETEMEE